MQSQNKLSRVLTPLAFFTVIVAGSASGGRAQTAGKLAVVKPVLDCSALAGVSLRDAVSTEITVQASIVDTPKGTFCHVAGLIAPAIHLEVDLPVARWTQRLLQEGCGGLF